jgi:ribosomal protein S18 acetylase RimI-like enzyme
MIRAARLEDLDGLVEVNGQVQALHLAARPDRYRDATPDEIAARFRELLADPERAVLVADDGGAVAGYAVVRRVDNPGNTFVLPRVTAHVDDLGVREDARRAGHGRALMAAVEAHARAWGAAGVTLEVQAFNQGAVAFYEEAGYAFASHRMSKPLG